MRLPQFTIQDLLWAMTIIGLACAAIINITQRHLLENRLKGVEQKAEDDRRRDNRTQYAVFKELERVAGKRVHFSYREDSSEPSGYKFNFRYEENSK